MSRKIAMALILLPWVAWADGEVQVQIGTDPPQVLILPPDTEVNIKVVPSPTPPPLPEPTIIMTTEPVSPVSGSSVVVVWGTTNAETCVGAGSLPGGSISLVGVWRSGPITGPTTFTLVCDGPGGTSRKDLTVTPQTTAMEYTFPTWIVASRVSLQPGESTRLMWASFGDECWGEGGLIGPLPFPRAGQGDVIVVTPTGPTTYGLRCTKDGQEAVSTVFVDVFDHVPSAVIEADRVAIAAGEPVTLTWHTQHVFNCTGAGPVEWAGPYKYIAGRQVVNPSTTSTYVLQCLGGMYGDATSQVTVEVT